MAILYSETKDEISFEDDAQTDNLFLRFSKDRNHVLVGGVGTEECSLNKENLRLVIAKLQEFEKTLE